MPKSLRDNIKAIAKDETDKGKRDQRIKDVLKRSKWYKGVIDSDGFTKDHKTKFITDVMGHSHDIADSIKPSTGKGPRSYTISATEKLAEHTGIDADNHPNTATAESDTDSPLDALAKKLAREGVVDNSQRGVDHARKLLSDHELTEEQIRDFHGTLDGNSITGRSFHTKKFKDFTDKLNADKRVDETKGKLGDANAGVDSNNIIVGREEGVADKLREADLDPDADKHAHIITNDQADAHTKH